MSILYKIDSTVVLTLDKRVEMVKPLLNSLSELGLKPQSFNVGKTGTDHTDVNELPPKLPKSTNYPTWWASPNAYNAWLSHEKILRKAYQDGVENLLLVEDDAFLENDFKEILKSIEPTLEKTQWDMLYFGCYNYEGSWTKTDNKNLLRLNGSGGWHGVLLKRNVIAELLNFPPIGPYDWICGKYIHPIFSCYAVYPCIISQLDQIYSNVEQTVLTKPSRYTI